MKLLLFIFVFISLQVMSQNRHVASLNQGECWNMDYRYNDDLNLKKFRIEIEYLDEREFFVRHICMVVDSFTIFNKAAFFGRKDNPDDTTLLNSELAVLATNKLDLNVSLPFNLELFRTVDSLPNIECYLHYSEVYVIEKLLPMKRYKELRKVYKKELNESSIGSVQGFFESTFCTMGCEGCYVEDEIMFSGQFRMTKKLESLGLSEAE